MRTQTRFLIYLGCLSALLGCAPELDAPGSPQAASSRSAAPASQPAAPSGPRLSAPWDAAAVKASVKVGRVWVLEERMSYFVGPKKQHRVSRTRAEIVAIESEGYRVRQAKLDAQGRPLEKRDESGQTSPAVVENFIRFDSVESGFYASLSPDDTQVSELELEVAGRRWLARLYETSQRAEAQEQEVKIWSSLEVPGLALKLAMRAPRMEREVVLVSFREAP